jgi:hypothetical protein
MADIIHKLEDLQCMDIVISNERILALYKIIMSSLVKKKYTLIDYIETIIVNLAFTFSSQFNLLLKFQIYSIIAKIHLSYYNIKINFVETLIDIDDDISLD